MTTKQTAKPSLFTRLALLCGTTLVCLAAIEIYLRLSQPLYPSIYQPDAAVLHKHVPNSAKTFYRKPANGGDRIPVKINSLGYRGPELCQAPAKRIVVYGDSCIAGEFSTLENTFCAKLQQQLSLTTTNSIEVINAGVAGYGPDQVCRRLEKELATLKPDLVIVGIFSDNDYGDLIRNKIYCLQPNGQLATNAYTISPDLWSQMQAAAFPHFWAQLQIVYRAKMFLEKFRKRQEFTTRNKNHPLEANDYLNDCLYRAKADYKEFIEDGNNAVSNLMDDFYDADIALEPESVSAKYKIKLMAAVIGHLKKIAANQKIPLLLVIIPSPVDVCPHFPYQVNTNNYPLYKRSSLTDILAHIAKDQGIPYLNLFPVFGAGTNDDYYFRAGDDHWNDAGQALAAKFTAEKVLEGRAERIPPQREFENRIPATPFNQQSKHY